MHEQMLAEKLAGGCISNAQPFQSRAARSLLEISIISAIYVNIRSDDTTERHMLSTRIAIRSLFESRENDRARHLAHVNKLCEWQIHRGRFEAGWGSAGTAIKQHTQDCNRDNNYASNQLEKERN